MSTIVHYGLCDLAYCGYFLHGLAEVADAYGLRLRTQLKTPQWLQRAADGHEHMQMISVFEVGHGLDTTRFCIDTHDKAHVVHSDLLDVVDVYFKASYRPDDIEAMNLSAEQLARIVPLRSPFMPVTTKGWSLRPRLQAVPSMGWTRRSPARRARQLRQFPTMERVRALRHVPKERDLLFVMKIYRQPHHKQINDFRYEVAKRLMSNRDVNAIVGLVGHLEGKYAELAVERVRPEEHLRRLASSRLGVYVVGTHDCLSFKFCEMMALGLPIVGQPIVQDSEYFNSLPGVANQFCYDDPGELVKAVEDTLATPEIYQQIAASNKKIFDEQLAPAHVAERILNHVLVPSKQL